MTAGRDEQRAARDANAGKNQGKRGGSNITQAVKSASEPREQAELRRTDRLVKLLKEITKASLHNRMSNKMWKEIE